MISDTSQNEDGPDILQTKDFLNIEGRNVIQKSQAQLQKLSFCLFLMSLLGFLFMIIPIDDSTNAETRMILSAFTGSTCLMLLLVSSVLNMCLDIWNVQTEKETKIIVAKPIYSATFMIVSLLALVMVIILNLSVILIINQFLGKSIIFGFILFVVIGSVVTVIYLVIYTVIVSRRKI